LLRGHFLLFDQKEAPTYPSVTGLRLLAIFVVLELVVGPRFALFSWLGLSPPPAGLRVALLLAAALLAARFWARAAFSDIGFLPWRSWTATERLYFPQVVLLANAIFLTLLYPKISLLAGRSDVWPSAAAFAAGQLLWGFYQEVSYRGILQTELTRRLGRIWGPLAANVIFTFGPLHFYHFTSGRSWTSIATVFAATFTIGLLFAFMFHRTRNIWLVGIFHGIGNVYINGASHIASLLS
jgi:membrane protease YdiL (CAAX protease family)